MGGFGFWFLFVIVGIGCVLGICWLFCLIVGVGLVVLLFRGFVVGGLGLGFWFCCYLLLHGGVGFDVWVGLVFGGVFGFLWVGWLGGLVWF